MNFGEALAALTAGARVQRSGWNGKDQWVGLQWPDHNSKMTLPYLYLVTVQGDLVPWVASQTDVLAHDWHAVIGDSKAGCTQSMTDEVKQAAAAPFSSEPMLQFFAYEHLPADLQDHSRPFGDLALQIVRTLPRNAERSVALRKLLEAKDCAVRARLYK